ncbi:CapA family protein [Acinetobacter beijerinckii]|uniref:Capsule synthesis protein CapA domain-containing protein n=1 Tax=Acinetobacter beijerinckii CIP 110307 TaxID=1217648 RepID=N9FEG1_9GAMM|nr:CapA family protein [Acinetobacter beijerinckii]ENW03281.1 hypothetical protein F933_03315 [Acinetobacter beijerinckii CIP 110307]
MSIPQEIKMMNFLGNEDFQHPIWQTKILVDCSDWILILLILEQIEQEKIGLDDIISDAQVCIAIHISEQRTLQGCSLIALLQYFIFTRNIETKHVLVGSLFGNSVQAQLVMLDKAKRYDLNIDFENKNTSNSIKNLYHLTKAIFALPKVLLDKVFIKQLTIGDQQISPISSLLSCEQLDGIVYLSDQQHHYYFSYRHENQSIGFFSLLDHLHRIDHLVPYYHYFHAGLLAPAKKIQAKSNWINIIGDTYFGEYYTKLRKSKGMTDALQTYGYQYSFEKIKQFFNEKDVNIANFEAVFNVEQKSDLEHIKAFILGADADETLAEFKRIYINTLCLANNHSKDYGEASLKYTLDQLRQKKIDFLGAGEDQQHAHQYLEIHQGEKICAIFNGYWHRESAYHDYQFYALGKSSGVACLNAVMFEQIMQYKMKFPDRKIIVICHWGTDFQPIHIEQEKLAHVFTQMGVDLVIGHGAHTIQPIKFLNNNPVIFGVGNAVFNSNGEFKKYHALPYGIIARLNLEEGIVKLYPILTDNLKTFWQPYPVDAMQFDQVKIYLTNHLDHKQYLLDQDQLGFYIQIDF